MRGIAIGLAMRTAESIAAWAGVSRNSSWAMRQRQDSLLPRQTFAAEAWRGVWP